MSEWAKFGAMAGWDDEAQKRLAKLEANADETRFRIAANVLASDSVNIGTLEDWLTLARNVKPCGCRYCRRGAL
jgi:hypothetical protein